MLDVCLLGCGGTMPLPGRFLTSLLVAYQGKMVMIDCGEGTQVSMKIAGTGFKNIDTLCFTHYHADHITGLPGLLLAIGNAGRTEPLTILGPPGLTAIIKGMTVITPFLPYFLELKELPENRPSSFQIGGLKLNAQPVKHNIPCLAYSMEVKRGRPFLPRQAKELGIPLEFWKYLQKGEEITYLGETYSPDLVLGPPRKGLKICYVTDSRPTENLVQFAQGADLLICEGMYGDDEKLSGAITYGHMLFSEAAHIAKKAGVRELWLTHFSPSLPDPENYLHVAEAIFPQTKLGEDRMKDKLTFHDEPNK